MGYKITMSEIGPISLNETDPVKSILQNVSIILRTIKGSCPMYRGFGIDATLIDRPIPAAKVLLFSQIREAIEEYEPRVRAPRLLYIPRAELLAHHYGYCRTHCKHYYCKNLPNGACYVRCRNNVQPAIGEALVLNGHCRAPKELVR